MSSATYTAGQEVRVSAEFTNETGAVDPESVVLYWSVQGSGVVTTATYGHQGSPIVKDTVGRYHADLSTTDKPGVWIYQWVAPGQTIGAKAFLVGPPAITP